MKLNEMIEILPNIREYYMGKWWEKWHDIYTSLSFFPKYEDLSLEQQKIYNNLFECQSIKDLFLFSKKLINNEIDLFEVKNETKINENIDILLILNEDNFKELNNNEKEIFSNFINTYKDKDLELLKNINNINKFGNKSEELKGDITFSLTKKDAEKYYKHRFNKVLEDKKLERYYLTDTKEFNCDYSLENNDKNNEKKNKYSNELNPYSLLSQNNNNQNNNNQNNNNQNNNQNEDLYKNIKYENYPPEKIIWGKIDNPSCYNKNSDCNEISENIFYPELFEKIKENNELINNNLKNIEHNDRQYVFGMHNEVKNYINCSKYFRSYCIDYPDNYIEKIDFNKYPYLYSIYANNLYTYTALNHSNLLFPIRYILKKINNNRILPTRKISHTFKGEKLTNELIQELKFDEFKNLKFMGVYLIYFNKINRYQPYFIFYEKNYNSNQLVFKLYDFELNMRYLNTIKSIQQITYIELIHLCIYYKTYLYKVKNKNDIKQKELETFVFSKFSPDSNLIKDFKNKYENIELISFDCGRYSNNSITRNIFENLKNKLNNNYKKNYKEFRFFELNNEFRKIKNQQINNLEKKLYDITRDQIMIEYAKQMKIEVERLKK
jgi:hypothetical protein